MNNINDTNDTDTLERIDALADLEAVGNEYRRLKARLAELSDTAARLIIEARNHGATPGQVNKASPFTSTHNANITRSAGIPAGPQGPKRRDRGEPEAVTEVPEVPEIPAPVRFIGLGSGPVPPHLSGNAA